ncbi:hypothetical protein [Scytonema sp. HK-05]|nr:hypothetical protein [Scytonema sp. HK-05]
MGKDHRGIGFATAPWAMATIGEGTKQRSLSGTPDRGSDWLYQMG